MGKIRVVSNGGAGVVERIIMVLQGEATLCERG